MFCEKTFDGLLGPDISGLIHCALSLRHGASLNLFRACLRAEVHSRLVVKRGMPGPAVQQHRATMLRIFLSGQSNMEAQALLKKLPNGDWTNLQEVEFYVPLSAPQTPSTEAIAKLLADGLVYALCRCKPKTWPRHRWTGAGEAVDELARLEMVHGLLSATYQRFVGKAAASTMLTGGSEALSDAGLVVAPPGVPQSSQEASSTGPGPSLTLTAPGDSHTGSSTARNEAELSADDHSVDRKLAWSWIQTDPFPNLLVIRLGMEPLRVLMFNILDQCSEDWELQQRASVLRSLECDPGADASPGRDYMLLSAAEGSLEEEYYEALVKLFEPGAWSCVPEHSLNVSFRTLISKVLSRQGCLVEQLLRHRHRQFPVCLFKLLKTPQLASEFSEVSECLKDEWTLQLQRLYPTLAGDAFRQTLLLHAELMSTSIAVIESKHASVRRQLKSRSVQTWSMSASTASAEWVAQVTRKSQASLLSTSSHRTPKLGGAKKRLVTGLDSAAVSPPPSRRHFSLLLSTWSCLANTVSPTRELD